MAGPGREVGAAAEWLLSADFCKQHQSNQQVADVHDTTQMSPVTLVLWTVFQARCCLEQIWEQTALGRAAGGGGHQAVSFRQLQQRSLRLSPSTLSHSSPLSRRKDTFPAERSCGIPSPAAEDGSRSFHRRCCVLGHVPALSMSRTGHAQPGERDRSRDSRRRLLHSLQHQLKTANFSRFSSLLQAFTHYDRVWTPPPWTRLSFRQTFHRDLDEMKTRVRSVALWWTGKLFHPQEDTVAKFSSATATK